MNKTVVVTGGTGGIGMQTALGLARLGARVVLVGRSEERGRGAVAQVKTASGNEKVAFVQGDLSSLSAVADLCQRLLATTSSIDVLINNAGLFAKQFVESPDGFESGFGVNVAAPWALTRGLLPALKEAAPSRVINVTGGSPRTRLDVDNLGAQKGFDGLNTYSHNKRAMEAMSLSFAEELRTVGVFLNIVYPGQASTAMTRSMDPADLPFFVRPLWPLISSLMLKEDGGVSAEKASRSSVWAATSQDLERVSGRYFDRNCREKKLHVSVRNPESQRRVMAHIGRS